MLRLLPFEPRGAGDICSVNRKYCHIYLVAHKKVAVKTLAGVKKHRRAIWTVSRAPGWVTQLGDTTGQTTPRGGRRCKTRRWQRDEAPDITCPRFWFLSLLLSSSEAAPACMTPTAHTVIIGHISITAFTTIITWFSPLRCGSRFYSSNIRAIIHSTSLIICILSVMWINLVTTHHFVHIYCSSVHDGRGILPLFFPERFGNRGRRMLCSPLRRVRNSLHN